MATTKGWIYFLGASSAFIFGGYSLVNAVMPTDEQYFESLPANKRKLVEEQSRYREELDKVMFEDAKKNINNPAFLRGTMEMQMHGKDLAMEALRRLDEVDRAEALAAQRQQIEASAEKVKSLR